MRFDIRYSWLHLCQFIVIILIFRRNMYHRATNECAISISPMDNRVVNSLFSLIRGGYLAECWWRFCNFSLSFLIRVAVQLFQMDLKFVGGMILSRPFNSFPLNNKQSSKVLICIHQTFVTVFSRARIFLFKTISLLSRERNLFNSNFKLIINNRFT